MQERQEMRSICRSKDKLSLSELRQKWSEAWGIRPQSHIGRIMLIKSLEYKLYQKDLYLLCPDHQKKLEQLIKSYKRDPKYFDESRITLKSGTRLIRDWNGNRYTVLVLKNGEYEYLVKNYRSLSQIAYEITGTRWNGWLFFGLKNKRNKS